MNQTVYIGVKLTANNLTDDELVALYNAAGAGFNPKDVMGYDKASHLFTEFDGTRMHSETLEALGKIVIERL